MAERAGLVAIKADFCGKNGNRFRMAFQTNHIAPRLKNFQDRMGTSRAGMQWFDSSPTGRPLQPGKDVLRIQLATRVLHFREDCRSQDSDVLNATGARRPPLAYISRSSEEEKPLLF